MQVCTIVARNYLAQARVLARSLSKVDPELTLTVLVVDGDLAVEDVTSGMELVAPEALGLGDDLQTMRLIYDVTEFSTAVKPALLLWLLRRSGGTAVYLDPDIELFGSLSDVDALASEHGVVLTPHLLGPLPDDGLQPSHADILLSGTYNLGFLAVDDREDARALLKWWDSNLRRDCIIDHQNGWFVDQRFMDLAPSFVERPYVLRDPAYNVAYWNLAQREVTRSDDGQYLVEGRPLKFFHYSGFDLRRPTIISKHQSRFTFADLPVVAELYANYADRLREEGFVDQVQQPYGFGRMYGGTKLTYVLRRCLRTGLIAGELPPDIDGFTEVGAAEIRAWLTVPHGKGALARIPEKLVEVTKQRGDVLALFGDDPVGFMDWARRYGRAEYPLFEYVLDALPEDWRPGEESGELATPPMRSLSKIGSRYPWGINVAGFLRAELGIGEAARNTLAALDEAQVPCAPVEGGYLPDSRRGVEIETVDAAHAPYAVNLVCVSPDVLERWVELTHQTFLEDRYTIGYWWWELEHIPAWFLPSLDLVDEIWCGSQFVANAFAAVTDKPVTQVRLPVEVAPFEPRSRSELGLPEGFLFLFLFDFNSSMQRKNPIGAIEAFRLAFEPEDGARLVIKTINAEMHPEIADLVDGAAAAAPHIDVVDRYVSSEDRSAMLASADCYVSLHRSEGLGLTPAEAMALGKPVIATGWSGNLDFMTDHNSYLVPYSLMPVGDDGGAYPAEGEWAEPDLAEAARLMRHVFEDRSDASLKGAKAASDLRETHSLEAAAASMSSRLEQLVIERKPAQPVGKLVEESQSDSARQRFAGSPAKRMLMRLMRPYTYHQDRVNDAVADELSRVGVELNVLRAELLAARRAAQRQGTRT